MRKPQNALTLVSKIVFSYRSGPSQELRTNTCKMRTKTLESLMSLLIKTIAFDVTWNHLSSSSTVHNVRHIEPWLASGRSANAAPYSKLPTTSSAKLCGPYQKNLKFSQKFFFNFWSFLKCTNTSFRVASHCKVIISSNRTRKDAISSIICCTNVHVHRIVHDHATRVYVITRRTNRMKSDVCRVNWRCECKE